jgi:hypothetical protein
LLVRGGVLAMVLKTLNFSNARRGTNRPLRVTGRWRPGPKTSMAWLVAVQPRIGHVAADSGKLQRIGFRL